MNAREELEQVLDNQKRLVVGNSEFIIGLAQDMLNPDHKLEYTKPVWSLSFLNHTALSLNTRKNYGAARETDKVVVTLLECNSVFVPVDKFFHITFCLRADRKEDVLSHVYLTADLSTGNGKYINWNVITDNVYKDDTQASYFIPGDWMDEIVIWMEAMKNEAVKAEELKIQSQVNEIRRRLNPGK